MSLRDFIYDYLCMTKIHRMISPLKLINVNFFRNSFIYLFVPFCFRGGLIVRLVSQSKHFKMSDTLSNTYSRCDCPRHPPSPPSRPSLQRCWASASASANEWINRNNPVCMLCWFFFDIEHILFGFIQRLVAEFPISIANFAMIKKKK